MEIVMALTEGDKAPEFSLDSSTGETLSLSDLKGKKVALYFYPRDDTPGCTIEACNFRDSIEELTEAGIIVLGVSGDSVESHNQFIDKFDLNFPLLADEDKAVSDKYGVWVERIRDGKTSMGIKRVTFLIDEEGTIAKIWPEVKPDGHALEVLEAAQYI